MQSAQTVSNKYSHVCYVFGTTHIPHCSKSFPALRQIISPNEFYPPTFAIWAIRLQSSSRHKNESPFQTVHKHCGSSEFTGVKRHQ